MKYTIPITFLLLTVATPALVARDWDDDYGRNRAPNISGTWYMNGDPDSPCQILQRRPDGRAEFINENGDHAWGRISGNQVFIPEWSDGRRQGLQGAIQGNRIIWPDGNYWSR